MNGRKENTIEEFRAWLGEPPELTQEQKERVERFAENFIKNLPFYVTKNTNGGIEMRLKGEIQ